MVNKLVRLLTILGLPFQFLEYVDFLKFQIYQLPHHFSRLSWLSPATSWIRSEIIEKFSLDLSHFLEHIRG